MSFVCLATLARSVFVPRYKPKVRCFVSSQVLDSCSDRLNDGDWADEQDGLWVCQSESQTHPGFPEPHVHECSSDQGFAKGVVCVLLGWAKYFHIWLLFALNTCRLVMSMCKDPGVTRSQNLSFSRSFCNTNMPSRIAM